MSNKTKDVAVGVTIRRRGRPAGKNRIPLSAEERRARNAQYERERRNEYAEAMAQLAKAAGAEAGVSNSDLLALVVSRLQRRMAREPSTDLEDLRRINENLQSQITSLTKRMNEEPAEYVPEAKKFKPSPMSENLQNLAPSPISSPNDPCPSSYHSAAMYPFGHVTEAKSEFIVKEEGLPEWPTIESSTDSHYPQSESTTGSLSRASREHLNKDSSNTSSSTNDSDSDGASDSDDSQQEYKPKYKVKTEGGKSVPQFYEPLSYEATYEISPLPVTENPPSESTAEYDPNVVDPYLPLPAETQLTNQPESMLDLFTDSERSLIAQWLATSEGSDICEADNYNGDTNGVLWGTTDFLQEYL